MRSVQVCLTYMGRINFIRDRTHDFLTHLGCGTFLSREQPVRSILSYFPLLKPSSITEAIERVVVVFLKILAIPARRFVVSGDVLRSVRPAHYLPTGIKLLIKELDGSVAHRGLVFPTRMLPFNAHVPLLYKESLDLLGSPWPQ